MMLRLLCLALPAISWFASASAGETPDGRRWWSHVEYLADDRLEGRDTGSPGHKIAAEYVAGQFLKLGLKPAGTDGYFQPIKFVSRRIDESRSSLELLGSKGAERLEFGKDAIVSMRVEPAKSVDAEVVFVGHGLSIPELEIDDFRGVDVKGKLAMVLRGAPTKVPGALAAHSQSEGERAKSLRKAGAIGLIICFDPKILDAPWERLASARTMPSMSIADPAFNETQGLSFAMTVSPEGAEKLLAGSGKTFAEILKTADADKPLPKFTLPRRLEAKVAFDTASAVSQNVAAVLPGADPQLKDEYVVLSAHLDHVGKGAPINGDAIYNGAMDNASGVASLLDVAAALKDQGAHPRRSILFVAVTGEEKGLLGSRYFASRPTTPKNAIVGDINLDMFLPLFPLKSLIVFGLEESDLGDDITAAAKSEGLEILPDPFPKRNVFIRSDQYSFIREGVPALFPKVGHKVGSPEEAKTLAWLKERYHAPSDDLSQPVDKAAAGAFDALLAKVLIRIADRDQRPRWRESSFFKRFAR